MENGLLIYIIDDLPLKMVIFQFETVEFNDEGCFSLSQLSQYGLISGHHYKAKRVLRSCFGLCRHRSLHSTQEYFLNILWVSWYGQQYATIIMHIFEFPKMGVPPNHPFKLFLTGFFHYKPTFFGYPDDFGNLYFGKWLIGLVTCIILHLSFHLEKSDDMFRSGTPQLLEKWSIGHLASNPIFSIMA